MTASSLPPASPRHRTRRQPQTYCPCGAPKVDGRKRYCVTCQDDRIDTNKYSRRRARAPTADRKDRR